MRRAKLILAAASGESNSSISRRLELDREQVRLWRERWREAKEKLGRVLKVSEMLENRRLTHLASIYDSSPEPVEVI